MRKTVYLLYLLLLSLRLTAQDDPRLKFQPIDDQHASVLAYNQDIEGDIVIPSSVMINGKSYIVTTIATNHRDRNPDPRRSVESLFQSP